MSTGPRSRVGPVPTPPRVVSAEVPRPADERRAPPILRSAPPPADASATVVNETSAGGFVVDMSRGIARVAIIARRNRAGRLEWCLPKGHLEDGESAAEAAVREIAEETGIRGEIVDHVGTIDYWFAGDGRRVHKVVHHYLLRALAGRLTVDDDPDGEAEDVAWIAMTDLADRLAYPNERRLASIALDLIRMGSRPFVAE